MENKWASQGAAIRMGQAKGCAARVVDEKPGGGGAAKGLRCMWGSRRLGCGSVAKGSATQVAQWGAAVLAAEGLRAAGRGREGEETRRGGG